MLSDSRDAILLVDRHDTVRYANPAAETLLAAPSTNCCASPWGWPWNLADCTSAPCRWPTVRRST
ncbi:PAS domain-containing protein [Pseudomonas lalucatii]|nr:PAS domain-containing protein [Pseudomonas lalucatii]